MSEQLTVVVIC